MCVAREKVAAWLLVQSQLNLENIQRAIKTDV